MRILHINCADTGSTGKIIKDISKKATERGYESFLCTPFVTTEDGNIEKKEVSFPHEQGLYKRISGVTGLRYGFAPVSTFRIIRYIKEIKPDIVHLHSANCNMVNLYKLINFLKKNKLPMVITNHAEFFYTGTCPHAMDCEKWKTGCGNCEDIRENAQSYYLDRTATAWRKMKKAFSGYEKATSVSVSPWVYSRASISPIMDGMKQTVILNGVEKETFKPVFSSEKRKRLGIEDDEKMILHVTAKFNPDNEKDVKGSRFVIELAKKLKDEKVKIIVVGDCAPINTEIPDNVILAGRAKNATELAEYYSSADLTVIFSKRETFSMVVAESLCCGTPVVGFLAGGPESITIEKYSAFYPQGDVDSIARDIENLELGYKNEKLITEISRDAHNQFSGERMAEEYISVYEEMLS